MPPSLVPPALVGRTSELHRLRTLIGAARNGSSGALVLRGDPGIGKSTMLRHATTEPSGLTVLRVDGYEAESSMAYAAVQRLSAPLRTHLDDLPAPQRDALLVATGQREGPPPERFLVGLGVLSLLARDAADQPVVCVIDDAHHLDAESLDVLAFVARRLSAESTVLLFATRDDPATETALAGVPDLRLAGLDTLSAVALLRESVDDELDPYLAARIAEQTGGNPLVLRDLAEELTVRELETASLTPEPTRLGRQLEAHYLARAETLTEDARLWLLVAAADTTGDPAVIGAVSTDIGLAPEVAALAEAAGLVDIRRTVTFRHPLARSAVYAGMPDADRRRVHQLLCAHADRDGRREVAAWHAAAAATGVDQGVADRLEGAADDAGARGGLATRARLLARAADLTPAGVRRSTRLIAAAEAAIGVGAARFALELLDGVDPTELGPVARGRALAARATLPSFTGDRAGIVASPDQMLHAAAEFEGESTELEQEALLHAFQFSMVTEGAMTGIGLDDIGLRMRARAGSGVGPLPVTLRAVAALILDPYPEAVPLLRRSVEAIEGLDDTELLRFGYASVAPTIGLWDATACVRILRRVARIARDAGALRLLDAALWVLSVAELTRGDPAASGRYVEQVRELRHAIGYGAEQVVNASYLAWVGAPRRDVLGIADAVRELGMGGAWTIALAGIAVRDIADGHYQEAYDCLREIVPLSFVQAGYHRWPDLVEAGVRSGHRGEIAPVIERLRVHAAASGTAWVRGVTARCDALVAPDETAEVLYVEAIEQLGRSDMPGELARAHLVYGEWLRRMRRRRDAGAHLRTAWEIFERVEAHPFAARARRELAATGAQLPENAVADAEALTAQEASVARLAAAGATNTEIGAVLFISPNTVDYHLRKVFRKLGVTSRRQLADRAARPSG